MSVLYCYFQKELISQFTIQCRSNSTLPGQMDHKYTSDSDQWSIQYPSNNIDGRQSRGSSGKADRGNSRSGDRGNKRKGDRSNSSCIDRGSKRKGDRGSKSSSDRGNKKKGDRGHSTGSREKNQPNHVPPPPYTLDVGMYDIFVYSFIKLYSCPSSIMAPLDLHSGAFKFIKNLIGVVMNRLVGMGLMASRLFLPTPPPPFTFDIFFSNSGKTHHTWPLNFLASLLVFQPHISISQWD